MYSSYWGFAHLSRLCNQYLLFKILLSSTSPFSSEVRNCARLLRKLESRLTKSLIASPVYVFPKSLGDSLCSPIYLNSALGQYFVALTIVLSWLGVGLSGSTSTIGPCSRVWDVLVLNFSRGTAVFEGIFSGIALLRKRLIRA
ncbi:hypothetical protein HD806DRAFT_417770 [Xylariaceae sp. AK1471]|nr:hypothetical protein HD806DRAFT_417770 [Xylariaceae sp. AK1471]